MNYEFPVIKHIDDVLPHIEGREEFIVAEREGYTVINYNVIMPDTFPPVDKVAGGSAKMREARKLTYAIRRECRGLIFAENGSIMSRPFHKFFNVNERPETEVRNVDLNKRHYIFEKLDGSMIRPLLIDGNVRLGTKMGITDVAMEAEAWLVRQPEELTRWMKSIMMMGFTPIFEWISPNNKIVVNYEEEDLVLLAVRDTFHGTYRAAWEGTPFNTVDQFDSYTSDLDLFLSAARAEEGCEGFVIRFDDGHMVKIKNDWYVRIHKALDLIRHDRHIIKLILEEELDDLIPMLPEAEVAKIRELEEWFWTAFNNTEEWMKELYAEMLRETNGDRKRVALEFVPKLEDKKDAGILFKMLDGKEPRDLLLEMVGNATGSNTKWDAFAEWLEK
jgi:RNA ligase